MITMSLGFQDFELVFDNGLATGLRLDQIAQPRNLHIGGHREKDYLDDCNNSRYLHFCMGWGLLT